MSPRLALCQSTMHYCVLGHMTACRKNIWSMCRSVTGRPLDLMRSHLSTQVRQTATASRSMHCQLRRHRIHHHRHRGSIRQCLCTGAQRTAQPALSSCTQASWQEVNIVCKAVQPSTCACTQARKRPLVLSVAQASSMASSIRVKAARQIRMPRVPCVK